MVQYASLYNDRIPYDSDRPFKGSNHMYLKRWDQLNRMQWVETTNGLIPPNAVLVGYEEGRYPLFVGRAKVMDSVAPGMVKPHQRACFVPWGGKSHKCSRYEVLCTPGTFVHIDSDNTLMRGTPAGISEQGEPLYIGRRLHEGSYISGKIQRSWYFCYIPFKKKELELPVFGSEIFIVDS
ncbi:uncharacterized protein LOC129749629 [Uranotaenia lowii]|uniref:uncharacterized protein LOC129749629 n=1 Tax=Uranotaenia lowii TaxID=190385 RepID=UPI00247924DE|nr:uncharacterized protein LOC129749629 [Uranotaenia lowii]